LSVGGDAVRGRGRRPLKPSEKREQIERSRTFLEDVDEDPDNQDGKRL
jgi:hypothetical protein